MGPFLCALRALELPAGALALAADKVGVDAALTDELFVPPLLDDFTAVEHQNLIGAADGFEPVGDHQDRLIARERFDCLLLPILILGVDVGGGLVENEDGRILEHGAGNGDALLFHRLRATRRPRR